MANKLRLWMETPSYKAEQKEGEQLLFVNLNPQ